VKRRPKSLDFFTKVIYFIIANVGGNWQDVATAILTEATLVEQPQGVELEYRFIAINLVPENPPSCLPRHVLGRGFCSRGKSGEGQASNTVMAVL